MICCGNYEEDSKNYEYYIFFHGFRFYRKLSFDNAIQTFVGIWMVILYLGGVLFRDRGSIAPATNASKTGNPA